MRTSTLGMIAIGLAFPCVGLVAYAQSDIAGKFRRQPYFREAVELIRNYEPAVKKLGEPLMFPKIDLADKFNYHDAERANVKIPVEGKLRKATVWAYATRTEKVWNLDRMDIKYDGSTIPRYTFYDAKLLEASKK